MRAVGYLRVSQADENIENQKLKILEFAKSKGLDVVGFFADVDVSGTVPPRERPQYSAMLQFCRLSGIRTIVFYDLSRLARSVEEGLEELKRLAEEGFQFYFAGMDFLNYDIDPLLKKKIIMDFLWFAELYVEDVKRRTRVALERLRKEGRLYHRPTLLHYVALYLSGKSSVRELTRQDLERAANYIRAKYWHLLQYAPYTKLMEAFFRDFEGMYIKHPKAPRSYRAFLSMVKKVLNAGASSPAT